MQIVPLNSKVHCREQFDCSEPVLNQFLTNVAKQQAARDNARTYVMVSEENPSKIIGFYTLALTRLDFSTLPTHLQKKYRYAESAALIARLAVDKQFQGLGYGGSLLYDALMKVYQASEIIGFPVIFVDAKDGKQSFYETYGFLPLADDSKRWYMLVETFRQALTAD